MQELHFGGNQLKQMPEAICKMDYLTYANFYQNFISSLPESLGELSAFSEMRPDTGNSTKQLILR